MFIVRAMRGQTHVEKNYIYTEREEGYKNIMIGFGHVLVCRMLL